MPSAAFDMSYAGSGCGTPTRGGAAGAVERLGDGLGGGGDAVAGADIEMDMLDSVNGGLR
ncbi:Uu.00g097640.m01.CDS01 [Anthostomella pinea]|uniref:Uu.00g097640.m01.CDS01 n=1 Tax=Anthostomella pinea TaxID=933095 RepID=A0AAI8VCE6_9PEZI|nr:Uu.00g097640.m01.CDS01 [Anthostomella pinea]